MPNCADKSNKHSLPSDRRGKPEQILQKIGNDENFFLGCLFMIKEGKIS